MTRQVSDSPILDRLDRREPGRDRSLDWYRWLTMNYGEIPDSITGEELGEVVPSELREAIEQWFAQAASEEQQ